MSHKKRISFQEIKKRVNKKCLFCQEDNYDLLNAHRINHPDGKYDEFNVIVVCLTHHRLIHVGDIVIDRKYKTSRAVPIVHYWEKGEEKWIYEELP